MLIRIQADDGQDFLVKFGEGSGGVAMRQRTSAKRSLTLRTSRLKKLRRLSGQCKLPLMAQKLNVT
jgi:hypothetical protein